MKTYTKIFVRTSILFASTLILASSSWAEAGAITGTETRPKPKKVIICANFDTVSKEPLNLLIQQRSPTELPPVDFTLSPTSKDHIYCSDKIELDTRLISNDAAGGDTVHWIMKNETTLNKVDIKTISLCANNPDHIIMITLTPSSTVGDTTPLITDSPINCHLTQTDQNTNQM